MLCSLFLSCPLCIIVTFSFDCSVCLSQQIVPEDLRPVLTDQVQLESNRKVHHRLDSPARADSPSTSSRPAQVALSMLTH